MTSRHRQLALLCLLLLAGFVLRAYRIDYKGLSFDESFSWGISRFPPAAIVARTALDVHPPLYYLCLKAWGEAFGAALLAPRILSALFGTLAILVMYGVVRESAATFGGGQPEPPEARGGALFGALLISIQMAQVDLSRTMRMYSLGVLLAGCTSWLLLRALRGTPWPALWWSLYGLAAGAFCYTHNYALFSVIGQGLWAVGYVVWRWRTNRAEAWAILSGLVQAGLINLLLFSPWLPVLWTQARAVRQGYWIPDLSYQRIEQLFFGWASGTNYTGPTEARLWLASAAGIVAWTIWRGGAAAWFFLVPALVPWLLSIGLSVVSGRCILVDRYFAIAQFSLLGLWGVTWWRLPGLAARLLTAGLVGGYLMSGLIDVVERFPGQPFAMAPAAEFLRDHHQPGDIVMVDDPCEINQLGYYVARAGIRDVRVQSSNVPTGGGPLYFNTCVPALAGGDFFLEDERAREGTPRRVWRGAFGETGQEVQPSWKKTFQQTFDGGAGSRYTLILVEKQ